MEIIKNRAGEKMYPVCNWENNQHKLYNAEDRIMIRWYEALENGTVEEFKAIDKEKEKIEQAMSAFDAHVLRGMVYATYEDRCLILEYVGAYNARQR